MGEEKKKFHMDALGKEGILMDQYRVRKLLEFQLDYVAAKNGLSEEETYLLFCFMYSGEYATIEEMADFTRMTQKAVTLITEIRKKEIDSKGITL